MAVPPAGPCNPRGAVLPILLISLAVTAVSGSQLPSISATSQGATSPGSQGKWWVQVGSRVYSSPSSESGLGEHVGDYYYALGHSSALSDNMRQHRVGGDDRLHVFYLPRGASMLQLAAGSRRSSLSSLIQLQHGMVVSNDYPLFKVDSAYVSPLIKSGKARAEDDAVANLTADSIYSTLVQITSLPDSFFPTRSSKNQTASEASLKYLESRFRSMGLTVCRHNFDADGRQLTNVVAHLPGAGPDSVTLGAHYDSIPEDGKAPGAEDNGSGLAVLLEVAKAFALAKISPTKNVYFTAFAGEEAGLLGSAAFAQALLDSSLPHECQSGSSSFLQKTPAHAAIVMDEVGWQSSKLGEPTVNLESTDTGPTEEIMEHLAQSNLHHNKKAPLVAVHNSAPYGSDHCSFLKNDIPAVMTINGQDGDYPYYHSSGDTISNVDKSLMVKIARMNLGAMVRMSGVRP